MRGLLNLLLWHSPDRQVAHGAPAQDLRREELIRAQHRIKQADDLRKICLASFSTFLNIWYLEYFFQIFQRRLIPLVVLPCHLWFFLSLPHYYNCQPNVISVLKLPLPLLIVGPPPQLRSLMQLQISHHRHWHTRLSQHKLITNSQRCNPESHFDPRNRPQLNT